MKNPKAGEDRTPDLPEFEAKLTRLRRLCDKHEIAREELEERDQLLRDLRQEGFDKKEIFTLIRGKLAEDTIRKIIAGVKVSEPAINVRLASLLVEMMNHDIHFSDVHEATEITKVLALQNVELGDIASLLGECKQGDDDPKSIVDWYTEQKLSGMSLKQLTEGLAHKKELEDIGLHYSDLKKISEIASKNGRQPEKVLDSISTQGNLESIKHELDRVQKEFENTTQKAEKANVVLMKHQVNAAHLQPVIAMCKELLHKYGYTTAAIESIVHIAMKYGGAFSVIKALEEYGNIETLKQDIHKLEKEKILLAADIAEKEKIITTLEGQLGSIESAVNGLLKSVRDEIRLAREDLLKLRGGGVPSATDRRYDEPRKPPSGPSWEDTFGRRAGA